MAMPLPSENQESHQESLQESPIVIFLYFHKAMRKELDELHQLAIAFETDQSVDILPHFERFRFLRSVYNHHSSAEEQVIFHALDTRVKNVAPSFSLEHEGENKLVNRLFQLLNSSNMKHDESIRMELTSCTVALRTSLCQHMDKKERELWPLFFKHVEFEVRDKMIGLIIGSSGADVWQSMLPWVSSALTQDEHNKMMNTLKQATKHTMFNVWLNEWFYYGPWIAAQQKSSLATSGDTSNSDEDGFSASFQDAEKQVFGCNHYKRNCKLLASCCGKLFTCKSCHDDMSKHEMDSQATSEMMCMQCLKIQPTRQNCTTPTCGLSMAKYYCNLCKLFDDQRAVYHCPFCNLCRLGNGLGIDYFHCMTCNCCLGMRLMMDHKCLEKALEINCPICLNFLFTSTQTIKTLHCGHSMHSACFQEYTVLSYTCPTCRKSVGDMSALFRDLDAFLASEEQPPEEFRDRYENILCNDCEKNGTAKYHWNLHKCGFCGSYNTTVI